MLLPHCTKNLYLNYIRIYIYQRLIIFLIQRMNILKITRLYCILYIIIVKIHIVYITFIYIYIYHFYSFYIHLYVTLSYILLDLSLSRSRNRNMERFETNSKAIRTNQIVRIPKRAYIRVKF